MPVHTRILSAAPEVEAAMFEILETQKIYREQGPHRSHSRKRRNSVRAYGLFISLAGARALQEFGEVTLRDGARVDSPFHRRFFARSHYGLSYSTKEGCHKGEPPSTARQRKFPSDIVDVKQTAYRSQEIEHVV